MPCESASKTSWTDLARRDDTTEQMSSADVERAMALVREASTEGEVASAEPTVPVPKGGGARRKADPRLGMTLGNLTLEEPLGAGNMGQVYRASHNNLGTSYAVKILHPRLSSDAVVAERFRREAMTCSQLRHPNVVLVTDFGMHANLGLYLVMEHLEGQTLAEKLETDGPLEPWQMMRVAHQICAGLEAAHAGGAVHRDLKPENVFLTGDNLDVKILDFGIARISSGNASLTQQGSTPGTPTYMSPEQIRGSSKHLGPPTDFYALGVILYEALTGSHPLTGPNAIAVMHAHLTAQRPLLGEFMPALRGTRLEALAQQLIAIDPSERPADAADLAEQLAEANSELVAEAIAGAVPPPGFRGRPKKTDSSQLPSVSWLTRALMKARVPADAELRKVREWNPDLGPLQPLDVMRMISGFVRVDLAESEVNDDRFQAACAVVNAVGARVLDTVGLERFKAQASVDGAETTVTGVGWFVAELLELGEKPRQQAIAASCEPLLDHPLFPRESLPSWARQDIAGSWRKMLGIFT